ncbi:hypothetical protein Lser_V15G06090 [Lactuca serriola]
MMPSYVSFLHYPFFPLKSYLVFCLIIRFLQDFDAFIAYTSLNSLSVGGSALFCSRWRVFWAFRSRISFRPSSTVLMQKFFGLYVCLNRGDVTPNAQKQSIEVVGGIIVSFMVDHIFLGIKDATVSDGAIAK